MRNKDEYLSRHTTSPDNEKISLNCHIEANYGKSCCTCSQSPTVGDSGLCGACFFGEADCIDPDNW